MNFPKCTNKLTNCESYGKDVCTSHGSWAQDNCKLYCGFCGIVFILCLISKICVVF